MDSTYFQHKKVHVFTLWKVMRIYFLDFHKYVLSISLFFFPFKYQFISQFFLNSIYLCNPFIHSLEFVLLFFNSHILHVPSQLCLSCWFWNSFVFYFLRGWLFWKSINWSLLSFCGSHNTTNIFKNYYNFCANVQMFFKFCG